MLGGGLLGLEAARAVQLLGLDTHVVEVAPRLMPRQLDDSAGGVLARSHRSSSASPCTRAKHRASCSAAKRSRAIAFGDGSELAVDMVIVSAGIRPRDELARAAGLAIGERGGIVVDDALRTSDRTCSRSARSRCTAA